MITKKPKKHYVNNEKLVATLREFKEQSALNALSGKPEPKIPDYFGECIMLIATRLATKSNFGRYPFAEEMKSDAIENCLMYFRNFDPDKGNAFAYFTQIVYYAFLRRIAKEKKQLYIKYKSVERAGLLDMINETQDHDNNDYKSVFLEYVQDNMSNFVQEYEDSLAQKKLPIKGKVIPLKKTAAGRKKKIKDPGLETYMED